jgi:hypothetical protein
MSDALTRLHTGSSEREGHASAVLGAIPSYPRPVLVRLVAGLIEHLDERDGDADLKLNGDELDGTNAED